MDKLMQQRICAVQVTAVPTVEIVNETEMAGENYNVEISPTSLSHLQFKQLISVLEESGFELWMYSFNTSKPGNTRIVERGESEGILP
jgi:hypothetical protein